MSLATTSVAEKVLAIFFFVATSYWYLFLKDQPEHPEQPDPQAKG